MRTTTPRTLAAALALALGAAGCGSGGEARTAAAPDTTAAPAETTTAPPTTTAPAAPATTEDVCAEAEAEAETVEGRALLDQAEAAGPPTAEQVEQIAEARWGALFERRHGCDDIWDDDDEARLDKLAARVGEAETGEDEATDPGPGDEPDNADSPEGGAGETGEGEDGGGEPAPEPGGGGQPDDEGAPADGGEEPVTPDDPEWVDELPEPLDPDPAPVGAMLDWDEGKLRPVEEVNPYVCEHTPYNCGPEGRWTWGPMKIAVGTRALSPGYPSPEPLIDDGLRIWDCPQTYRWTVTGFAPSDVGPGGLRSVRILLTQDTDASGELVELIDAEPVDPRDGCAEAPECPGPAGAVRCVEPLAPQSRPTSALAVVLPEHAETISYDSAGNMTGATLLVFFPPPRIGG